MAEAQPTTVGRTVHADSPAPVSAGAPLSREHYVAGKLTRAGMEYVIAGGGSVIYDGRVIANIKDLPSEAAMAKGDTVAEAVAQANIDRQRAALDAQEAQLRADKPTPKK